MDTTTEMITTTASDAPSAITTPYARWEAGELSAQAAAMVIAEELMTLRVGA